MSWLDRLQPASFRGIEFFVDSDDAEFGRRQVTHTAALVDVPTLEDLGRAADSFSIEGYLLGDDFDVQLAQLIKAIRDTPGEGRLVHPRYGERMVGASGFRVRHSSSEGRMCRFAVTFGEAGELGQPTEGFDAPNVLANRSREIQAEAEASFVEKFVTAAFPQFVRDAAEGTLTTLGDFLAAPGAGPGTNLGDLATYQRNVQGFINSVGSLVSRPATLAGSVTSLITSIRNTFGSASRTVLGGLLALFPTDNPQPNTTPSRNQIVTNNNAIGQLVRQEAAAELATEVVSNDYPTLEDAIAARDEAADALDLEAERTDSDTMYQLLTVTRADVISGLPAPDQSLAQLVPYVPPSTMPALVIAQTLYDDATRESQIVTRNTVRHPGFTPGGQALQVLTDG